MGSFEVSTIIGAPPSKVWEVLTKSEPVKRYMPGTDSTTDWKVGSPIRWTGVLQGKPYENRGAVLKFLPGQLLEYTYWSDASRLADSPENYSTITCLMEAEREGTMLTIIVKDIKADEEMIDRLKWGWNMTVSRLAKLAEEQ